jgi:hypothetical protein
VTIQLIVSGLIPIPAVFNDRVVLIMITLRSLSFEPMLCGSVEQPGGNDWWFELKLNNFCAIGSGTTMNANCGLASEANQSDVSATCVAMFSRSHRRSSESLQPNQFSLQLVCSVHRRCFEAISFQQPLPY